MSNKRKRADAVGNTEDRSDNKRLNAACTACRKQKIKCELLNDEPPCSRCQRRGLSCVLHTAQRHPMADYKQIAFLGRDVTNLFSTLEKACNQLGIEPPAPLHYHAGSSDSNRQAQDEDELVDDTCELSPPESPSAFQAPIDTYLTSGQHTSPNDNSPRKVRRRNSERSDIISKGLVSLQLAEDLVTSYLTRLDRFLYGIAAHFKNIYEVRHASPALLAAMCAVAAFHDSETQETFELCNREYRALVSMSLFEKRDLEFIRALCIGSFWLPDASRILVSDAIRRSSDCRLHRSFHQLTEPMPPDHTDFDRIAARRIAQDKTRLWYLLYICDQHLSILHNRDCIMRQEKVAIENRDLYLAADTTISNQDIRIMSQVSLLVIMGQIRDVLGSEQARPLPKTLSIQITHFNRELDQWFHRWSLVFEPDEHIGHFPLAGLTMHYNFAKLFLGHQVFRGLGAEPIPLHFLPPALTAREAALTIFTMIVENEAFRSNVLGMPHYFHIMISFAGQFLLEVCMKFREQLNIHPEEDCRKVSAALAVFARTTTIPQHPITRVTTGLMRKLNLCTESLGIESVLTDSPFGTGEYAVARDLGAGHDTRTAPGEPSLSTQLMTNLPDDFMFADLGDFSFPDPQFQFLS